MKALIIIIPLTAIMVTLFAWLRQDIKSLGERVEDQSVSRFRPCQSSFAYAD